MTLTLDLPPELEQRLAKEAAQHGLSVEAMTLQLLAKFFHPATDPTFPNVAYRQGASGQPVPVVAGTGIRIQTLAIALHQWGFTQEQLAEEYNLSILQIEDALAFYAANQAEIDGAMALEAAIEASHA